VRSLIEDILGKLLRWHELARNAMLSIHDLQVLI